MDGRVCTKCLQFKEAGMFFRYTSRSGDKKLKSECIECGRPRKRKYYHQNKETIAESRKKYYRKNSNEIRAKAASKTFNVPIETVLTLREITNCEVCGDFDKDKSLAIDHDHETGEIRGVLCSRCNTALGLLRDSEANIENLLQYLRKFNDGKKK